MKSDGILRHAAVAMVIAVILYAGGYSLDQHLRIRRGPWQVTFSAESSNAPAITINQPALGISNLKIVFVGEVAGPTNGTVIFDVPEKPVPFGKVIFEDLTYLPGTVTLDAFGHEIELIPRTLFVNRQERGWPSGTNIVLSPADKRSFPPRVKK